MALDVKVASTLNIRIKLPGPVQAVSMSIIMFKIQNQIKPVNTTTREEKANKINLE